MTLVEFLLARIAEDKAVARATLDSYDPLDWGEPEDDDDAYRMAGPVDGPSGYGSLIVDPARVLAECEAKRTIVEETIPERDPYHGHPDYDALWVVRLLALPYAGHPDYDEAWRPA